MFLNRTNNNGQIKRRCNLLILSFIALTGTACAEKTPRMEDASPTVTPSIKSSTLHPLSNDQGGRYTISNRGRQSLERPQPLLTLEQQLEWAVGKSFAKQAWITSPATTTARDGLGPLFNANSCTSCHKHNGQGQLPPNGNGLILRLESTPQKFGEQLQDRAVFGVEPEGQIDWQTKNSRLSIANKQYQLSQRQFFIAGMPHIPVSARLAPALIGMGLLDRISDADILANSDPNDRNKDGISGQANLRQSKTSNHKRLGRFGWKASQTSLHQQVALAFFEDMGITSSLHPKQPSQETKNTAELDISDKLLLAVTNYIANLAVPAASHDDLSQQGSVVFNKLGCAGCHIPTFNIGPSKANFIETEHGQASLTQHDVNEAIYPFSDLLLHDMGAALADSHPSDHTPGNEWRTAPLWGLGMRTENPDNTRLLHDGRARSISEAILWHAGEAEQSRLRFTQLSQADLTALLHFLKAL
ncbi:Uncharacterised protein [Zhongshania aliphaticivorans]|uniref:Cytochrome c domain-containing protein n=1 Tax=Zhongshania aliphaticivorans TaxID=1470434 RepID=A0A5S9QP11_9GAMM|nr:di-heme oxidoredictase family protein [Zhongshania aliphaticivorans]CAA0087561.1 Uncharacterised protein [Zhongshania aliphaticivorans]CAA0115115.1 Uncharacterised protein [Zhongshania aliphaticivorans]CAA0119959.1 Uncharacterised protein [Zhongshania aliphaticivorans]